jgi:hypothetical protein
MSMQSFWLDNHGSKSNWLEPVDYKATSHWEGCARNPDHTFYSRHHRPLRLKATNRVSADFCWYTSTSAIITQEVADLLKEYNITGYELHPVEFYRRGKLCTDDNRVELEVTGWGGVVPKSSGVRLRTRCTHCECRTYSMYTNAAAINSVVPDNAPDIFIIWPFSSVVFISARMADLIEIYSITGGKLRTFFKIKWPAIMLPLPPQFNGISPGSIRSALPRASWDKALRDLEASDVELTDAETEIS